LEKKLKDLIIEEVKEVYKTVTNSDLTEGRGYSQILAVAEIEETAARLGLKQYVMGTNCPVYKSLAIKIDGTWYAERAIVKPSKEDLASYELRKMREEAEEKAKSLGLSDADIAKLKM
jgi:hypothetical protein